jgi:VWFA-related protein
MHRRQAIGAVTMGALAAARAAMGQEVVQFRASARLVLVPVQVADAAGKTVENLTEADFELYDQGTMRKFRLETENAPLSVMVAVQTSVIAGPALAKVQKIGSLLQPLVAGERGQVAVVTYSDRIEVKLEFSSEAAKISEAIRRLEPNGQGGAMHDAVVEAVALLAKTPDARRRVLLLIGEGKDRSSKTKLEEAVTKAQAANVTVYPASFSAYATAFTSKGDERFESGRRVYNGGGGMNILDVFREIGRSGVQNSHEALAKYTGGLKVSFAKLKGLEEAVQRIGADLHTQYLLSFQPLFSGVEAEDTGYRELRIRVRGLEAGGRLRHRPGYWRVSGN